MPRSNGTSYRFENVVSENRSWEHYGSHSPDARPVPMSVEVIRKDSLNEMWNGIIWSVSTRPGSPTNSTSIARGLPSLSAEAPKAPPTMLVHCMGYRRSTQCGIPVSLPRDIEWNNQDAEKGLPLRSRIVQTLNVPQGYASALHSLRPCRRIFLSILWNNSPTCHPQITLIFKPLAA